jgi:hypothetical protein
VQCGVKIDLPNELRIALMGPIGGGTVVHIRRAADVVTLGNGELRSPTRGVVTYDELNELLRS